MHRTRTRPIPAGRMLPREGLITGVLLGGSGVTYLALAVNGFSAFLAALTVVLYVFAYTPLKRVSTTNTLVGAIPGAIPPVIGWAAAGQPLDRAPGPCSRFFSSGKCRTSSPSPGCIERITRGAVFA